MLRPLTLLLLCQLTGEALSRGLWLPVPGPVLGLVFLLLGLHLFAQSKGSSPDTIEGTSLGRTANALLQNLALLFVPAGVGVVQHLGLLGEYGLALVIALVGSTVITLLVTVFVFQAVGRRLKNGEIQR
jgi:holin-like protein